MGKRGLLNGLVALAALAGAGVPAGAQPAEHKALTLAMARKIVAAAEAEAVKNNLHESVVVLDEGGVPILFQRMDDSQLATYEVAIAKGRTALLYQRPSKAFEDVVRNGFPGVLSLPGVVAVEGGVPISLGGRVVGAVGASGGTPALDGQVANAGANSLKE